MTTVFNKESFIKWLEKNVPDDKAIIVSSSIDGELKVVKRRGVKITPIAYATEVFKAQDGVGDIYFGKVKIVGLGICDKDQLSDRGQEICERSEKI